MRKLIAACATILLATTLGFAQGTASQSASDDNTRGSAAPTTRNYDVSPRRDFGWIGLLGLLGLAGLRRRPSNVVEHDERGSNLRRVA